MGSWRVRIHPAARGAQPSARRVRYSVAVALKSTICKAVLDVSDVDRNYYAEHALTIARHPSETDERMMVRSSPSRSTRTST